MFRAAHPLAPENAFESYVFPKFVFIFFLLFFFKSLLPPFFLIFSFLFSSFFLIFDPLCLFGGG